MRRGNFAKKSFILILSNLATSILGFIFSITLSEELGPEGMGLYGLVRPLNRVFMCLICGGLVIAVSKISSEYYSKGDYKNLKRNLRTSMAFTFLWSVLIATLIYLFSSTISTYIIKDTRTVNALRLLCPAMIFISLSNCLKGYFYGTLQVSVPMLIDIFEKAVRIFVLVAIISSLKVVNVTSTVTGAYFALCIGEIISFTLLYGYYRLNIKGIPSSTTRGESRAQLLFDTISISFPLLLTSLTSSVLSSCSALIIPRRLVSSGFEYKVALGMIGKFNGMAKNIAFFPMVVIESISILLIPDLSKSLSKKDYESIDNRISKVIELSFLLGATVLIIILCIGDNLGSLLYKRKDLGSYIKCAALAAPIFYTASTTIGILNGLGKQKIILRNSIIVSILRIILLYIFTGIPSINIYGYGIASIITSLISLNLNIGEIRKISYLRLNFFDFIIDALTIVFSYFILIVLTKILPTSMLIYNSILIILSGFLIVFSLKNMLFRLFRNID